MARSRKRRLRSDKILLRRGDVDKLEKEIARLVERRRVLDESIKQDIRRMQDALLWLPDTVVVNGRRELLSDVFPDG